MKKLHAVLLAAVLSLGSFAGCVSTPTGGKTLNPITAAQIAPALRASVSGAVVYAYTKDKNSLKYVAVIQTALNEFVSTGDLSPSVLQAKLYALPVKELKTPEAQLLITPLIAAYQAYGEQYVNASLSDKAGWKLLVQALVSGLNDGIAGVRQIETSPQ